MPMIHFRPRRHGSVRAGLKDDSRNQDYSRKEGGGAKWQLEAGSQLSLWWSPPLLRESRPGLTGPQLLGAPETKELGKGRLLFWPNNGAALRTQARQAAWGLDSAACSQPSWVTVPDTYPILAVTVPGTDDGPRLLDHLQDSSSMDIAGHIGVIWPHNPRQRREKQNEPLGRMLLMKSDNRGEERGQGPPKGPMAPREGKRIFHVFGHGGVLI